MHRYHGSCLCGSVKYVLSGEFQSFFLCHCTRCQKGTGSAYAANLFAKGSKLVWLHHADTVKTYQHANTRHVRSFCGTCGAALPVEAPGMDAVVVPAGSLDDSVSVIPTARIFVGNCASWAKNTTAIPGFEKLPEQDTE